MADENLRELERRWQETGNREDGARYYIALARAARTGCPKCGHGADLVKIRDKHQEPRTITIGGAERRADYAHATPQLKQLAWPLPDVVVCAACGVLYVPSAAAKTAGYLVERVSEPDGDFCVLAYCLEAISRDESRRVDGSPCATNAFDYAAAPTTLMLDEGYWRCGLTVQGGGRPGMVRVACAGLRSAPVPAPMLPCAAHVMTWSVRVPRGITEVLRMEFRRARSYELVGLTSEEGGASFDG